MRILIIRYSSLGDIVITTPVIKAIYDKYDSPQIDFLIDIRYAPILKGNPHIQNILSFDREENRLYEFFRLKGVLPKYDIVFDLQNKLFSRIIARAVKSREVYTFRKNSTQGKNRNILDMYSDFLGALGIPLEDRLYKLYYARQRYNNRIGINIEGSRLSKRLSTDQIFGVIQRLNRQDFEIVLIGSNKSRNLAREISCRFHNIIDTTDLDVEGLIETIATLSVLITPDSGPMHIASALDIPTVAIFGSTSPHRWLPRNGNITLLYSNYDCSPCSEYGTPICREQKSFSCITSISTDIIIAEAVRLYEQIQKEG